MDSITLGIAAANMGPGLIRAIARPIMQYADPIAKLPYRGTGGYLNIEEYIEESVPSPNMRLLGDDAPSPTRGTYRRESRYVALMDLLLTVDSRLKEVPGLWGRHWEQQVELCGKGAAFKALELFLHGNHLTTMEEPDGLITMLDQGILDGFVPASQRVNAGTGGATVTFAMLDQLDAQTYGDNRKRLANRFFERKLLALARDASTSGIIRISEEKTTFGKPMQEYNGIPFMWIERTDDHSSDLPFDENDGSGNLDTSRIIEANFSETLGVYAFGQDASLGMKMPAPQQVPTSHQIASLGDWSFGFQVVGPTAQAHLVHLNQA